jgi:oxygen-independent coproporphyrinogen-3 oxidase
LGRRFTHISFSRRNTEAGEGIQKHFAFSKNIEAGVEIDPRRLTRDHVAALREAGFNRASFGVQDF